MANQYRRTALPYFGVANLAYANARLRVYEIDEDTNESTGNLAALYAGASSDLQAPNPYVLSAQGQFTAPLYAEVAVIMVLDGAIVPDHETGIIYPGVVADLTEIMEDALEEAVAGVQEELDDLVAEATQDANDAAIASANSAVESSNYADASEAYSIASSQFSSELITDSNTTINILAAIHKGKYLETTAATPVSIILPSDANDADMVVNSEGFIAQGGVGAVTLSGDPGVTVKGTPGLTIADKEGGLFWKKTAANTYRIHGYLSV